MSCSIRNLSRMAAPDTGEKAIWHYTARDKSPLEPGYFNAAYQMLGEDDIIFCVIYKDGISVITTILTVTESSRSGVKVRGPNPAAGQSTPKKESTDGSQVDRGQVREGGDAGAESQPAAAGTVTGTKSGKAQKPVKKEGK